MVTPSSCLRVIPQELQMFRRQAACGGRVGNFDGNLQLRTCGNSMNVAGRIVGSPEVGQVSSRGGVQPNALDDPDLCARAHR